MRTKLGMLLAGVGCVIATAPALAHHGFDTEYDASKKFTLSGVVQKVEWQNPHMRVYVDVTDASGKVTTWNMEMTSPNTVRRQGWGPKDLVAGEKVTFTTYGGKVIETRGSLVSIKKASDGRELFVAGGPDASVPK
ncbi:MAG TPA: DUF6152 family protein [Vicinamibacterales bacterium]|nr:DUF6152 family protein [Vicinamibacterales bacterium]